MRSTQVCLLALLAAAAFSLAIDVTPMMAQPTGEADDRPLPLATSWNCRAGDGYSPVWQMEQIRKGHHLLFTYRFGKRQPQPDAEWIATYKPIFEELRERNAPICFRWGNWLDIIKDKSPFSPVEQWHQAGKEMMEQFQDKLELMQQWYPDPPYVVMLSNNEGRGAWGMKKMLKSQEYTQRYGEGRSEPEQEKILGEAYVQRYRAMFDGMQAGSGKYGPEMLFIGYAWGGLANVNVYGRLDSALSWDGVSAREYRARNLTDHTALSVPMSSMNLRLKKEYYDAIKDRFFFEISTWWQGFKVEPVRYGGMCTWAMWLSRPHAMRHFTGWGAKRERDWKFFSEVVEAVDQVQENETLAEFWKKGEIVARPNTDINAHVIDRPSGTGTRSQGNLVGYVDEPTLRRFETLRNNFYHIPTSVDPEKSEPDSPGEVPEFPRDAEFPVWAQAHVIGERPNRRWLVFTYAPLEAQDDVKIMIPDGETVTLDVPQAGVYAVVEEGKGVVETFQTKSIVD
jgi:hypothetical protein